MQKYLFLFTIGPVQSFIAQARKTRDLYAGSQLLSQLIGKAIEVFKSKDGHVIFPQSNNSESLPNRFTGTITLNKTITEKNRQKTYLQDLVINKTKTGIEDEVRTLWKKIATDTLNHKKLTAPIGFWEQIDQHLEIYWVFYPLDKVKQDGTKETYKKAYKELEKYLGSVKNMRSFQQFNNGKGEQGRKCSIDGERNALFFGRKLPSLISSQRKNAKIIHSLQIEEYEGLSAVSFVKRFMKIKDAKNNDIKFPSTAKVALLHVLSKAENNDVIKDFKVTFDGHNLIELLKTEGQIKVHGKDWQPFDEQFYFEDNLNKKNIKNPQQLKIAIDRHKILKGKLKNFTKYYALLTFDGDKMGEWLSGNKIKLPKGKTLEDFHNDFSGYLNDFAEAAKKIVKEPKGVTVYTGGDDYLGLVNLHSLFDVIEQLEKAFEDKINKELIPYKTNLNDHFTFSAGVVIAHYKTPLHKVMDYGRRTLEKAKEYREGERNSYGIRFMNSSTTIGETYFKPKDLTKMKNLVEEFKNNNLSSSFLFKYRTQVGKLPEQFDNNAIRLTFLEIYAIELRRVMKRAIIIKDKKLDLVISDMEGFLKEQSLSNNKIDINNFIGFTKVADKISIFL